MTFSKNQHDNKHLQEVNGHLWINTRQFLDDFKKAMDQIYIDIKNKGAYYKNANKRLKEFNIIKLDEQQDMVLRLLAQMIRYFNHNISVILTYTAS